MDYNKLFNDTVQFKKAEVGNATDNYESVDVIFTEDTMELKRVVDSLDNKYVERIEGIVYEGSIELYYEGEMIIEINLEKPDLIKRSDKDRDFTVSVNDKHNYHIENITLRYQTSTKYFYLNGKELKESPNAFYENSFNNREEFIAYIVTLLAKIIAEKELIKLQEELSR